MRRQSSHYITPPSHPLHGVSSTPQDNFDTPTLHSTVTNFNDEPTRDSISQITYTFSTPLIPTKFMSFNVNGLLPRLKTRTFLPNFRAFLLRTDPDILCLQEVKLTPVITTLDDDVHSTNTRKDQALFLRFRTAFAATYDFFCSLADTKYAGQLVMIKKSLPPPIVSDLLLDFTPPDGRLILVQFPHLTLVTVYVPNKGCGNDTSYRRRMDWDAIFTSTVTKFLAQCVTPFILCGDFNTAHTARDVSGSLSWWRTLCPFDDRPECDQGYPGTTGRERECFTSMLSQLDLTDTLMLPENPTTGRHTCRGTGDMLGTSLRLDYFLTDPRATKLVSQSLVHNENFFGSDHCPISLILAPPPIPPSELSAINTFWDQCHLAHARPCDFPGVDTSKFTYQELKAIYHIPGTIHHQSKVYSDNLTLFDGGATNGNFAHPHLLTLIPVLRHLARPHSTSVQLGDQHTKVTVTHSLALTLSFYDEPPATAVFYVLGNLTESTVPPKGPLLIIGVPALFREFGSTYKHLTDTGFTCFAPTPSAESSLYQFVYNPAPIPDDCVTPWAHPFSVEAPEDEFIDDLSSYREFDAVCLNLFDRTHDEAMAVYLDLFDTHVSADCRAQTDILDVLKSDVATTVYVPKEWKGLNWPPIHIEFSPDMPARIVPYNPRINPVLYQPLYDEFKRKLEYQLRKSDSPHASPIVVSPKATAPFIRFCYNLQVVNGFMKLGHYPIPIIRDVIDRIGAHCVFIDTDMKRSYHQFKLDAETSAKLSVVTPFGQYEPIHMPEGVAPAQHILQHAVTEMFCSLGDWLIVVFDNILICAHTQQQSIDRFRLFLDRCAHFNVMLSFEKTWIGFDEVKFFGYVCRQHKFRMDPDRFKPIAAIPFPSPPEQLSKMRSFLGMTRMYAPFLDGYGKATALLDAMTSTVFSWDESTWTADYRAAFTDLKTLLESTQELFYPDYSLVWILSWDASEVAVGGVLSQVVTINDKEHRQPIMFFSSKLSESARKWHIYEKECYAGYFCLKKAEHLLRGHRFIMETDAKNLLAMEKSSINKVVRMCNFYKSFDAYLRHIPRAKNHIADYFTHLCEKGTMKPEDVDHSLLHMYTSYWEEHDAQCFATTIPEDRQFVTTLDSHFVFTVNTDQFLTCYDIELGTNPPVEPAAHSVDDLIQQCHGHQQLHHGVRRTWLRLNSRFPGHGIPINVIQSYIDERCAVCQKFRIGLRDQLPSITRHLKVPDARHTVAVDTLTISPPSHDGYKYLIVMVNLFTHIVMIHKSRERDAISIADALMHWIANRNLFRHLQHDPGSDIMSDVVQTLESYLGISDCVTLIDSPRSNGVEPTNKLILRHLNTLVHDARLVTHWSDSQFLDLIQFELNNWLHSETGAIPFEAEMGSTDEIFRTLPSGLTPQQQRITYIAELDKWLCIIREHMSNWQTDVVQHRASRDPPVVNTYAVGDLVLHKNNRTFRPTKLWCPFSGPYRVTKVVKDDVTAEHLSSFVEHVLKNDTLKPFFGTMEEAERAAQLDYGHFTVSHITNYTGDPVRRTTLEFRVVYSDGDWEWRLYGKDLASTEVFQSYIACRPELYLLTFTTSNNVAFREHQRNQHARITQVTPPHDCFVHLRAFGATWYQTELDLPDTDTIDYHIPCRFTQWANRRQNKIILTCPLFNREYTWTQHDVRSYGIYSALPPAATLVTRDMVLNSHVLQQYSNLP